MGSNPQTQSHKSHPEHLWDTSDPSRWNFQVAVLYVHCSRTHYSADLALSNHLLWNWGNGGWMNPEDGSNGDTF
jgi:hypothetical protein